MFCVQLLIGNFGLSYDQSKTQMAIWAVLAAPLIMSNNLKEMRAEFKEILQNKNVIKVNQDALGIQGTRVFKVCNFKLIKCILCTVFFYYITN